MKKFFLFFLSLGIILPVTSFAFKADAGENLNLTTPINDDYYVGGSNINLNTNVNGDLCIAGGKMYINGNISQDIMGIGGEYFINGNIGESARIAGGTIVFEGTVEKDFLVAGGNITIGEKSNIKGETKIWAGTLNFAGTADNVNLNATELTLKGSINGNATIRATKITVQSGAKIAGNLYYESPVQNTGLEQIVSGKVTFQQKDFNNKHFAGFIGGIVGMRFFFLFIFGLILLFVGQKRIRPSLETVRKHARESLGIGFITYVGLPIAAVICAITVIGLPFSFVLITIFITLLIFAKLLNVYFYTNLLIEKWWGYEKLNNRKKIWILLGCCIISGIVSSIDIIFAFFALGAIIKTHILKKK